jgi:hypothetical protein
VVLSVGGCLGLGTHLLAVPFKSLVLDEAGKTISLPGATRKALMDFLQFQFRD